MKQKEQNTLEELKEGIQIPIGKIRNYYGGISIMKTDDKYYWGIQDWDDNYEWHEISQELYTILLKEQG